MTIKNHKFFFLLLLPVGILFLFSSPSSAEGNQPLPINGHLKIRTNISGYDSDSIFSLAGVGPNLDGQMDVRLKNTYYFSDDVYLQSHYEGILTGGDTRRKTNRLLNQLGLMGIKNILPANEIEDDRRLMDLTHVIVNEDGYIGYHRMDRLVLGVQQKQVMVTLGRQAQTWGNGMVFNPMDLFNPFSPTDIQRDYKIGDDMVAVSFPTTNGGDVQVLYVIRRDLDHEITWGSSSLAAKYHVLLNNMEMDIMAAHHYEDRVAGLGTAGTVKNAAWRMDGTWTFIDTGGNGTDDDGFFSFVANLDYSWIWGGKNYYGFLEFYHNGLGRSHYFDAFFDKNIMDRISRGELFTIGKNYLSAMVQCEVHPLFNVYFTVIENIGDPSGILLPRAIWDITQNIQITIGATVSHGAKGTEFGGVDVPGTGMVLKPAGSAFIWAAWYF